MTTKEARSRIRTAIAALRGEAIIRNVTFKNGVMSYRGNLHLGGDTELLGNQIQTNGPVVVRLYNESQWENNTGDIQEVKDCRPAETTEGGGPTP